MRAQASPEAGVLRVCVEKAAVLEVCLEQAWVCLGQTGKAALDSSMQHSIERQLQHCQEMFVEIEQKVSSVSALGGDEEQRSLSAKLQKLKKNLLMFQLVLQEKYTEEQVCVGRERPLQGRLTRSCSVQEILTSARGKLFRQSSLQQQRELEQGLSEQRELTKAIAARGRLHSQTSEEHTGLFAPAAVAEDEQKHEQEESVHRKWTHLQQRLTHTLTQRTEPQQDEGEISEMGKPAQIPAPPGCVWSSTDGAVCLQELQSNITHLRELGQSASAEPDVRAVDERLFEVLSGVGLSLSSLSNVLLYQPCHTQSDAQDQQLQLQSLSAELVSLGSELTSQGSEVMRCLGPGSAAAGARVCLDLLQERVCELQIIISEKQKQLQKQLDHTVHQERRIKHMHATLLANISTTQEEAQCDPHMRLQAAAGLKQELQQKERELEELREGQTSGLTLEISTLENLLDSVWCSVRECSADVQCRVEQQQQCEVLMKSLQDLLKMARERLTHSTHVQLDSTQQLRSHISTHSKFFLSLDARLRALHQLSAWIPGGKPAVAELEEQVDSVQRQALDTVTALHAALQVWTQWEESQAWLEKLLLRLETQLSEMHLVEQTEEELQERVCAYEALQDILQENRARIGLVLDLPCRIQKAGVAEPCEGVSCSTMHWVKVSALRLKQRLAALRRKIEHGRDSAHQMKKLWDRYHRDSAVLHKWMDKAKGHLHNWKGHMILPKQDTDKVLSHYKEFTELSKELEVKSALKGSVIGAGTAILQMSEREQQDTHTLTANSTATSGHDISISDHGSEERDAGAVNSITSTIDTVSMMETVPEDDASIQKDQSSSSTAKKVLSAQEVELFSGSKDKSLMHSLSGEDRGSSSVPQACETTSHFSIGSVDGNTPVNSMSSPMALSPALLSLQTQLTQVEHGWMDIFTGVPAVQQQLHQCVMDRLSPQGLLTRVSGWISAAGRRLDEAERAVRSSSITAQLRALLNTYKLLKREQACEQWSVDFLNHSVLKQTDPDSNRYKHTAFSEQLGELNFRWLALQSQINTQLHQTEQKLRVCADREGKLRLLHLWMKGREEWMLLAERPVSRFQAENNLKDCEELDTKLKTRSAELREMERRLSGDEEVEKETDFIKQIHSVDQSLTELTQQNVSLRQALQRVCTLWSHFDSGRSQASLGTLRIFQSLEHCHAPHTSLTALEKSTDKLKTLQAEAEELDRQWEELDHTLSSLSGGIHTGSSQLLLEQQKEEKACWLEVKQNLTHTSVRSHTLLEAWKQYSALLDPCSQKLHQIREQLSSLSQAASEPEGSTERLSACVRQLQELLEKTNCLQTDLDRVHGASKELVCQMEPSSAAFVKSECRLLTRGCLQLEEVVKGKLGETEEDLKQLQEFEQQLESLEGHLEDWKKKQSGHADTEHTDVTKSGLLELSSHSADLELLNGLSYRLTLSDLTTRRLQTLNKKWAQASAHAQERCSELQAASLQKQDFEQRCESWMVFLQRMEDNLVGEMSSTYPQLRQQLRTHQHFQAELSLGHQILHSVITEALLLLHRGEVDDRSDFLLKLAQLREHWQGAVQRAAQRRSLVEGLVQHWHLYTHTLRKLRRLLTHTHTLLPPAGPTHCSVLQLRLSLEDMKRAQLLFCRSVSCYLLLLDVGRQLFPVSDEVTQARLQTELATLQDDWESSQFTLGKRSSLTADIIKTWESCAAGLANHTQRLEKLKTRLNQPIQETEEEHGFIKEIQDSLDDWAVSLSELSTMKTDLSQYIISEDVLLLQEQVDHLHGQWDELCLKVSLRKQEIADRLNAWIIFNEKNRELCEWLTHMENKVADSAELSIEEMVEKLKKDCMEEINLFSENKTHLKQLGEQLISASNKTKETEVNDKIKDISDRWQHLFDHIEARVRKLKETLVMVQQLDKNMSNLRTWLSRIEGELSKPVVYSVYHDDEIQRKLAEQQDLQRDIEQHTEGVASVLTLCDMLLHDADACGSDVENDSIQQTTRSLDRRWRNICAMSMERRMRIEETWRLWRKFLEDYSRFEDWLTTAEHTAANPASTDVLYTCAKEELKKFEAFQRQVHERLTQLELVNKQYRRLARENRTDTSNKLKTMVNEGNQRWDALQRRVAAVLRRLKHFTSQREDFEGTREAILVWLTEMDLQLTNVEHFSESDIHDKMRQLNAFQQEITLNTNKIDALIVFGENLIQKSSPLDAVLIEDELEELHSYCQEVFGRVARFHHRLINRSPVLDDETDFSDRDTDVEDSLELGAVWAEEEDMMDAGMATPVEQSVHVLLPPPHDRSGRETPVSVDSIPLEWDHTVDVGGSSSPEDEEEEEATFYSALSVGRSMTEPPSWHSPPPADRRRIIRSLTSSPVHTSTSYHPQGYAKLMSECTESIDNVKRVKLILDDDEMLEDQGLTTLSSADKQTGVIERWELQQAREMADLQQWHKLTSDLIEVTTWLDGVVPELEALQRAEVSGSIRDMENSIHKLKEVQKTFSIYKALMIGMNVSGQDIQRGDRMELQELRTGLHATNQKWTHACALLDGWEFQLHRALLQCQEFHEKLHSLLLWLARAESQRYMVNIHDCNTDTNILQEHRDTLKDLQQELCSREQEVLSLQEISTHILHLDQGEDSLEAKEKVHVISNKLCLLLRQVAYDLNMLQDRLDFEGSSVDSGEGRVTTGATALLDKESRTAEKKPESARPKKKDVSPGRPFLYRVLRAAFPLHLLFLMLLVLACLVPLSEDDYSCTLSNNFARSFYPMLRYINGPPPT